MKASSQSRGAGWLAGSLIARTLLTTLAVTLLLIVTLIVVGRPERWPPPESPPRQGEALESAALAEHRVIHSERALGRLIREPQNTWTNLAFVIGGALLMVGSPRKIARALGLALIAVGVGSFLYHASASRTLRQLDVAGMYWLFVLSAFVSVTVLFPRMKKTAEKHVVTIAIASGAVALLLTAGRNFRIGGLKPFELSIATAVTAIMMLLALGLAAWRLRTLRAAGQAVAVLVLFGVAVACQLGDRPGGWLCDPDALIQAHALWHIFSAAAFVLAAFMLTAEGHGSCVAQGELAKSGEAGRTI